MEHISKFQKRNKISTLLDRHFHIVVVQKRHDERKVQKVRCTCKGVVLLIKPTIVILTFSLPSRRWI